MQAILLYGSESWAFSEVLNIVCGYKKKKIRGKFMAQLIATIFEISGTNRNYICSTASGSRRNTCRKIQNSVVVGTTF